jgi:hypothetical protein
MKSYDSHGNLVSKINTSYTNDGKAINTNTLYNTNNGQPTFQHISVRDSQGKVTTTNIING